MVNNWDFTSGINIDFLKNERLFKLLYEKRKKTLPVIIEKGKLKM